MKIATFNVNSLRARLSIVLDWLREQEADVLCVQETKVQDVDFPRQAFDELGYECAFKGQKSYNGVAIISRNRMHNVGFGFTDEPKDEPRLATAQIDGITVVNTYVPQGYLPDWPQFQYKLTWFDRLLEYFKSNHTPSDPLIWLGDLNIAPEAKDVYDPQTLLGHVCFHPEVHKALSKALDWGFVDVFRKHCDQPGQYTFWDYRLPDSVRRNLGWRLDHIMATKPLAETCGTCYIDKQPRLAERPSDHTPVVAEFDW